MGKNNSFHYIVILVALAFSCTDKSIDLEVKQDACNRFKISRPSYSLLEDPCNDSVKIRTIINFEFNRSVECLNRVNNFPVFYRNDNSEIAAKQYTTTVSKEALIIDDKNVSYIFEASFSTLIEATQFNHVVLDFNTQNELGVSEKKLQIRINTSCSTIDPSTYTINKNEVNLPRSQSFFTIRLWDNAAEDGDIVSVYLNEKWIIENHTLLNDGTEFTFSTSLLMPGKNDLVVFALNEGSSGPNTVSIAINNIEIKGFSPGLLTGEAVRINF